jgi:hypothetical protein
MLRFLLNPKFLTLVNVPTINQPYKFKVFL